MSVDKKAASGDIRYVLLNEPGQAIVSAAPQDVVARVIQRHSPPGAGA
jgi:3-dehydroquinate synthase